MRTRSHLPHRVAAALVGAAAACSLGSASLLPAAAVAGTGTVAASGVKGGGSLPQDCQVQVGEAHTLAYLYANKAETYLRMPFPKGVYRHTWYANSPGQDDMNHLLGITPDGRVFDGAVLYGVYGYDDVSGLFPESHLAGRTVKGLVDIAAGASLGAQSTSVVYAVDARGAFLSLPVSFAKKLPQLGKPLTMTAKGMTPLRGIELLGHAYQGKKVTRDYLWAHTRNGRLLELTVDRTTRTPRVSTKVIAAKGFQNVAALAIGWCGEKSKQAVIVAIEANRQVRAYVDPNWTDSSLKGAKVVNLAPWTRSPVAGLF